MPANRGGPWYPKIEANVLSGNNYAFSTDDTLDEGGTRRGEYAKFAMNGLLANGFKGNKLWDHETTGELVKRAFIIADCMISHEDST